MKKILIIFFVSSQIMLSAQDIIPIPVDTTSVWSIWRGYSGSSCGTNYESTYYIDGTVINGGKEYYKVYEEGYYWETFIEPGANCDYSYYYSGVFRGAIMTENGKTYGYTTGSPHLLMDFTLSVGDTLNSYISDMFVINSIDSVIVGDTYRKRFNMSNYWTNTWMIEGIGHQGGLFESMDTWGINSVLYCYGENSTPIFGDMNCDITVGHIENIIINNQINVYPNPVRNELTISSKDAINVNEIIIYNQLGQKALHKIGVTDKINVSMLDQGIYIIELISTDFRSRQKLIIK